MKRLLLALLLIASHQAFSAPSQSASSYTGVSTSIALNYASNTTIHDLLVFVLSSNSSSGPTSVTTTNSETVVTLVPWGGDSVGGNYIGIYVVVNATGGADGFAANFGSSVYNQAIVAEYALTGYSKDTAISAGTRITSNPFSVGPLSPAGSDLGIAAVIAQSTNAASWNSPFTNEVTNTDGADFVLALADGTVSSSASATQTFVPAGAISYGLLKPAGGSSCTHTGYTSAGAIAIPTASSTSVWLQSGAFGTTDCSAIKYWQIPGGAFGAN